MPYIYITNFSTVMKDLKQRLLIQSIKIVLTKTFFKK